MSKLIPEWNMEELHVHLFVCVGLFGIFILAHFFLIYFFLPPEEGKDAHGSNFQSTSKQVSGFPVPFKEHTV